MKYSKKIRRNAKNKQLHKRSNKYKINKKYRFCGLIKFCENFQVTNHTGDIVKGISLEEYNKLWQLP